MKSAVILILLSGSLSGYGQGISKFDQNKPLTGTQQVYPNKPLIGTQLNRSKSLKERQPVYGNQANKNNKQIGPTKIVAPGAYPLSPDNMPCVVPDMAILKPIPNSIREGHQIPFIPNGFKRNPTITLPGKKPTTGAGKSPE